MRLVIIGILYLVIVVPLSFWTDRNLDFWLSQIAGHPVDVPFWMCLLLTTVSNVFGLAGNVLMEVLRLAV